MAYKLQLDLCQAYVIAQGSLLLFHAHKFMKLVVS